MDNKVIKLPTYKLSDEFFVTTKVKDLMGALKDCNPEASVFTEGCDCIGEAKAIRISDKDNSIEILRNDN